MKFTPNTMKTKEDARLALIDQGYENIDDHPVLRHYGEDGNLVEDFVIPVESAPKPERRLTNRELKKLSQLAASGPRVTIDEQGVVMTPDEIASQRSDDERVGRY